MKKVLTDNYDITKRFWLLILLPSLLSVLLLTIHEQVTDYPNSLTQKEYVNTVIKKDMNIVFYKRTCPYCKAGKKAVISEAKKSAITTYFVDVETKEGKFLAKKFNVDYAPSIVTIRKGKSKVYLYAGDKDNKKVVFYDVIKDVFVN
ncbi:thioredoxin domain-containing protein [Streptococcus pluranimalium]|uniref:thioredoxin domain-containing protein n=1 Tax=Streptococcus pluranimalium TaxID=82348 RepID=UPI003F66D080